MPPLVCCANYYINMFDTIISFIAPHACVSCGRPGSLLCAVCLSDEIEGRQEICISCGMVTVSGICSRCMAEWGVERAFIFGERTDILKTLIDEYKYSHKRAAAKDLARLMASLLPYDNGSVLIPLPTIAKHIRQRGYDHMVLLARRAARLRSLHYAPLLIRRSDSVQHGATKRERLEQAKVAFKVRGSLDPAKTYIIFDDITTTGASLKAAVHELRTAGARYIWVAALARQPLD